MNQPISIFIMDVTNSTYEENWEELTDYLKNWETNMNIWGENNIQVKVNHRMGDEILFIGQHYFTAYLFAFYISLNWKFPKQKPYFGISFGQIDKEISIVDIDTWNHPLIKKARNANEQIKNNTNRDTPIIFNINEDNINIEKPKDYEEILNLIVQYQFKSIENQTKQQNLICSLYLIFEEQKKIASLLGKSSSTISSHFKNGESEMIFKTFNQMQEILNLFESFGLNNEKKESYKESLKEMSSKLNETIKNHIKDNLTEFYPELK